jgi:hypothetical protein
MPPRVTPISNQIVRTPSNLAADCVLDIPRTQCGIKHAGRGNELPVLYETEARATNNYERLVGCSIGRGRLEDAEHWACEGIEKMAAKLPGIAFSLIHSLCELAGRRRQWDVVAAHAAHDFFSHPSVEGLRKLVAAAE